MGEMLDVQAIHTQVRQSKSMKSSIPHSDPFTRLDSTTPRNPFGAFVRGLRRARGLTLEQAAQASGIGRVTLNRWEGGAQRPRLREIEALLAALGAGAAERRQALTLLDTPETHAVVRDEVIRIGERLGLGPQPGGGDMLRAMRQRRGLSSDQAADLIGVSGRTIRRWERGEAWPPTDRLHALCKTLGAYEEEMVALTVGNFSVSLSPFDLPPSVDEVRHDLTQTHYRIQMGEELLVDLRCLPLEAQAWRLAAQSETGRGVLRQALNSHATGLANRGHDEATLGILERVLELGPGSDPARPDHFWVHSGVSLASGLLLVSPAGGARSAWGLLRSLQGMTPLAEMKAWILSVMADCLVVQGAGEEALALGEESCRIAERANVGAWDQRRSAQADRLLRLGRPSEALDCLDGLKPNTPLFGLGFSLSRTEALLGLGDMTGAEDSLRHIYATIETYDLVQMRDKADRLASRLWA
jgi:transcriptional regulator with XRE-family HTH domain